MPRAPWAAKPGATPLARLTAEIGRWARGTVYTKSGMDEANRTDVDRIRGKYDPIRRKAGSFYDGPEKPASMFKES